MIDLELVKLILDVLTAIATAAAATAAWLGVRAWRSQLAGTTEHETARKVLREVYRLQRELQWARNPASYPEEGADRVRGDDEQMRESETRDVAHAYGKRLQRVLDARTELQLVELDALALWGEPAAGTIQPFHRLVNTLASAHWSFFAEMIRGTRGERRMPPEFYLRLEGTVWEGPSESDSFASELQTAVRAAEGYFRRFMASQRA